VAGIAYALRPQPSTEDSLESTKKRKAAPLKVDLPRTKSGCKWPSSDIELALMQLVKKTRKFALAPSTVLL
jgi:hypothetical protein